MSQKRNVSNNLNILLQAFRCIKSGGRFLVVHDVPRYRLLDNDNSLSGEQSLFRLVRRARCERNPPPGSRAAIFCHARRTKRVTHNGLSERGTTRSLNQNQSDHSGQLQITQTIHRTNQSSEQVHITDAKCGKCARPRHDCFCSYF